MTMTNTCGLKPLIGVEANIGGGKTTFCREIAKRLNLRMLEEPVDMELLRLYYDDSDAWAFSFQIAMLHRRWAMQMSAASECIAGTEYDGAILDRMLWGDMVFAEALFRMGKIHQKEWEIYLMAVRNMCMVLWPPTVLVYLDVQPETALERIRERDRPSERGITIEYLRAIHEGYHRLIREAKQAFFPWSHTMDIVQIPWDPVTCTSKEWDRVAATVKEAWVRRSMDSGGR